MKCIQSLINWQFFCEHRTNQCVTDELKSHIWSTPEFYSNAKMISYFGNIKIHQTLEKIIPEGKVKSQRDLERRMWRTVWGQVSGESDEQQKIG